MLALIRIRLHPVANYSSGMPATSVNSIIPAGLLMLLVGCASDVQIGERMVLQLPDRGADLVVPPSLTTPDVEVFDIRLEAEMERNALGASMGAIEFVVPETELIHRLVESRAIVLMSNVGLTDVPPIICGIRRFDIKTPSTPLYWDMVADIELVLRVHDIDHTAFGKATARTWIWPTTERLQAVVDEALLNLGVSVDTALTELLGAID
jgi:hypothetical protein